MALMLSLAIFVAFSSRSTPVHQRNPERLESVSFRNIRASIGTRCVVRVGKDLVEIKVWNFGSCIMAMACDMDIYWFWMKSYEPQKYHFCSTDEVDKVGLNPLFSPTFARCASGVEFIWRPHPEEGDVMFNDGIYLVKASFSGGMAVRLSYSTDGKEVLSVRFTEHQMNSGHWLTRRMVVAAEDLGEREVDLGEAEVNLDGVPFMEPPKGMNGVRLAIRR